jgi:hypothetical protein
VDTKFLDAAGVRPSSGAATSETRWRKTINSVSDLSLAAAEDGRTEKIAVYSSAPVV